MSEQIKNSVYYDKDFIISIKNPIDNGYDEEKIKDILKKEIKDIVCFQWHHFFIEDFIDEVHICIYGCNPVSNIDIKRAFPDCNIINEAKNYNKGWYYHVVFVNE